MQMANCNLIEGEDESFGAMACVYNNSVLFFVFVFCGRLYNFRNGLSKLSGILTITTYFIHPSGKLKVSFDLIH